MKVYTLLDRWHLDSDMADDYKVYVFKSFAEAKQKAEEIIADFQKCAGVKGTQQTTKTDSKLMQRITFMMQNPTNTTL